MLYASSSARDTDWHVRLVDVHPDGSARFLCHGMLRARFRESFEEPQLLEPGEVYRFEFGMDAGGVRFLPGHRIRVEVMSSWFPGTTATPTPAPRTTFSMTSSSSPTSAYTTKRAARRSSRYRS